MGRYFFSVFRYLTLGAFICFALKATDTLEVPTSDPNPTPSEPALKIESLYGTLVEKNPLIRVLINHPAILRMRQIDNAGPSRYFRSLPAYSLFDHAFGVYVLLKRFNRPLKEQLAGLLEPVAHSVFSHQGTLFLRPKGSKLPYYLAVHESYLKAVGLDPWLMKAQLSAATLNPTLPEFPAISKNPPFLSAIEIEMTLRLAFSYKLLTPQEIEDILRDLRFDGGEWFFVTKESAEKLASLSLYFAEKYWGAPQNYVINRWVAAAMKRAIDIGQLDIKEVRFGIDKPVLEKLMKIKDPIIHGLMVQCRQPFRFFDVSTDANFDEIFKPEFRGLNPLVKQGSKLEYLTAIDPDYAARFAKLREDFIQGIKIKFKRPPVSELPKQQYSGGSLSGSQYKIDITP